MFKSVEMTEQIKDANEMLGACNQNLQVRISEV